MADCIFCGKSAGFFRKFHKKCWYRYEQGKLLIKNLVAKTGAKGGKLKNLESSVDKIAMESSIDRQTLENLVIEGWEKAVETAFEDGVLSKEEEDSLADLMEYFSLTQEMLDQNGAHTKVVKGGVLRDLLEGKMPERLKIKGNLPFNFQKSEKIVWYFENVKYFKVVKQAQYMGRTGSVGIRIAKGLYYRSGGFSGEKIQAPETINSDAGLLGVTDKNIYFAGSSERFRIPYSKIVSFVPYSDGIGIQRDSASAGLESFETGDGWFTYNLITNMAQMHL